jgi:cytoskeletal protein RodZ
MTLLAQDSVTIGLPWILGVAGGAVTVIGVLFRLLISSKDALLAAKEVEFARELIARDRTTMEMDSMKRSYQEIASEAVKSAIETTNYYRGKYENKPPILTVAPVVSESHSPSTAKQRESAAIATLRASMALLKESTGQEPRPEPPAGPN